MANKTNADSGIGADAQRTVAKLDEVWPGARMREPRLREPAASWLRDRLKGATVGVFGATGAVGLEVLALLREARHPAECVRVFGSPRSAGRAIEYGNTALTIEQSDRWEDGVRFGVAVLATPAEVSRALVPRLLGADIAVSDNSSAFRLDPAAALVVPEINGCDIRLGVRLASSPNCTTTVALTAGEPLRRAFGVRSIAVASYQAVSGAGLEAMQVLVRNTADYLVGGDPADRFAAFDAFPHETPLDAEGWCGEEQKLRREAARLWGIDASRVHPTCVRVPVLRTHLVAVTIQTERIAPKGDVEREIAAAEGVELVKHGPRALCSSGACDIAVGRVVSEENADWPGSVVRFVAAGDQLLKGAAWNALQNAALLLQ